MKLIQKICKLASVHAPAKSPQAAPSPRTRARAKCRARAPARGDPHTGATPAFWALLFWIFSLGFSILDDGLAATSGQPERLSGQKTIGQQSLAGPSTDEARADKKKKKKHPNVARPTHCCRPENVWIGDMGPCLERVGGLSFVSANHAKRLSGKLARPWVHN